MSEFKYVTPQSLKEAIALIHEYRGKAGILAGGTDLLARIRKGLETPEVLINIDGIRDLNYIRYDIKNGLHIGAATPIAAIEKSAVIRSKFPLLTRAASLMASPTIRSRATIGGNLGNAAPSADIVPALIVLGAGVKIIWLEGERWVPVEEFFVGPGQTVLQPGQLITEIRAAELPPRTGAVYLKQKRREGADLAVAGVAAMVTLRGGDCDAGMPGSVKEIDITIEDLKIALGAVAPTPIRAKEAEDALRGQKLTEEILAEAGRIASGESRPIDDVRSSAEYRRKLVAVLVPRAVREAVERMEV